MITKYDIDGQTKQSIINKYKDGVLSKNRAIRNWPDDPVECDDCGWTHVSLEYANIDIERLSVYCPNCGDLLLD